ncbi:lipoyl(octanoyl) transferase LipB [Alphaproteobacteria bacterium]|jgi:lipoyl(octanoyl) transferase|nr:lipoyl(octanoyl) transferase LipB [Alphaproteobacteria bacterium]
MSVTPHNLDTQTPGDPTFHHIPGYAPYTPIIEAMQAHAAAIRSQNAEEVVWLLEHAPVLTGGTSASEDDLVNAGDIPTHLAGRGGQWTYHGPGQRVAYVMLDLTRRQPDVRAYVSALESWIIDVIGEFGVVGIRRAGLPGIWVPSPDNTPGQLDKIAAIGVRISRWVTWHGIAINLDPDLSAFDRIIPCGVRDGGVTSLAKLGVTAGMDELDAAMKAHFRANFGSDFGG